MNAMPPRVVQLVPRLVSSPARVSRRAAEPRTRPLSADERAELRVALTSRRVQIVVASEQVRLEWVESSLAAVDGLLAAVDAVRVAMGVEDE